MADETYTRASTPGQPSGVPWCVPQVPRKVPRNQGFREPRDFGQLGPIGLGELFRRIVNLWTCRIAGSIGTLSPLFSLLNVATKVMPKWRNGRRAGLKILCPQGRVGSTPTFGTK